MAVSDQQESEKTMSAILAFFTTEGMIVGNTTQIGSSSYEWSIENPVFVVPQDRTVQFIPVLGLVEESKITLDVKDMKFGSEPFTPTLDLRNHYNKLFGSGIVEVSPITRNGLILS